MSNSEIQIKIPNLVTVKQFCERYPAFNYGGIRFQIFNEKSNGLYEAGAIVRVGKKVLIDVQRFFEWVETQNPNRKLLENQQ